MGYKRTIAVVGSDGSGKTQLIESILFLNKVISTRREDPEAPSLIDTEEEEKKRKFTIKLKAFSCGGFNFIDTPGIFEYRKDIQNAIIVSDGVLFVYNPEKGLTVHGLRIWEDIKDSKTPVFVVINGIDKGINISSIIDDLKLRFGGGSFMPVTVPLGDSQAGVFNLFENKGYSHKPGDTKFTEVSPDAVGSSFEELRVQAIESIVEQDEELMEKYLETGDISMDVLGPVMIKGILSGEIIPLFCTSALNLTGIPQLLSALDNYVPSPDKKTIKLEEGEEQGSEDSGFLGYVFNTSFDPFSGKFSYVKVMAGVIDSSTPLFNSTKRVSEKISGIQIVKGKDLVKTDRAVIGDIVVLPKLSDTHIGDTLCTSKQQRVIHTEPPQKPVLFYAVKPKGQKDEQKITSSMNRLLQEESSLVLFREPQTKELILGGLGQIQIDIFTERLKRKFDVEIELLPPKIPYRETITKSANAQGKYKKQTGGRGQYGDTWIKIEPQPRGKGFEFVDNIVGGVIPKNFIPSVEKGIKDTMEKGLLAGYPIVDVKVTLYDGSHHSVDSSDMAFQIAGSLGFKKAYEQAAPVILEPIMKLEIVVPDDYIGQINGDITSKRGKILKMEPLGGFQRIVALAPQAEIQQFAAELSTMTQGQGYFTMEFDHYEIVPPHLQQKIIEESKKASEG